MDKNLWVSFFTHGATVWGLKALILLLVFFFIIHKVQEGQLSFRQILFFSQTLWTSQPVLLLLFPVLLVFVNWGLEAKKWQLLVAPLVSISFRQAVKAVITGLSLGFITPRSIGDYAGRLLETPVGRRGGLVGAVLLNRLSQSFITYMGGLTALVFLARAHSLAGQGWWSWLLPFLILGTAGSLFLLSTGRGLLLKQLSSRPFLQPLVKWFGILGTYTSLEIIRLVFLAFLRYLVFSLQFVLVLWMAGINLPAGVLLSGVAVVFMLKSVIPAFNFLSDLGVREFSALIVFSVFAVPENQLVLASLLVWCMNILFPTLLGVFHLLRLKTKRNKC